jgi:hypothetical protein
MAKSRMLTMIGVAVIAAGAFGVWARRASQAPPAAERTGLRWPAGIERKGDVGFHAQEGPRVVKRSVEPVARQRHAGSYGVGPPPDVGRIIEETQQQLAEDEQHWENAPLMALESTALHAAQPEERIQALQGLNLQFDTKRTEPILEKALSDSDPQVRAAAVDVLSWNLGADAPLEPLARAAADRSPEVRMEALTALFRIDDERKVPLIKDAMQDPDLDVRVRATAFALVYTQDDAQDEGGDPASAFAFLYAQDENGDAGSDYGDAGSDYGDAGSDSAGADVPRD